MADTQQGAVRVKGIHRHFEKADTLVGTSGRVDCCCSSGLFGFHSLRKSVVQGLQTLGVSAELRAACVGHELVDYHLSSRACFRANFCVHG